MSTSEAKNQKLIKSISRMIWLNKKIATIHEKNLLSHSNIVPRVLLDENCSSKKVISALKQLRWQVKLVRYAERGLSDEIVFSLFDDWRPHLFITFDKHFAQYDRFRTQYDGMIDETGQLEKWLPIIFLLPSRLVKSSQKTARYINNRIKRFFFDWEEYKEYQEHILRYNFGILTLKGERRSHTDFHAPFKLNIYTDVIEIDLSKENLTFISLSEFPKCVWLKTIKLSDNELKGLNLSPLRECTNLHELCLSSNEFESLDINHLIDCKNLKLFTVDERVKLILNQDSSKGTLPSALEKLKEEGRIKKT